MTNLTEPGYLFAKIRAPDDPKLYYPMMHVWTEITLPTGDKIFPSIEHPTEHPRSFLCLGPDFDGNIVGLAIGGKDHGKTFFMEVIKAWAIH